MIISISFFSKPIYFFLPQKLIVALQFLALELYLREPGIRFREPGDPAVMELSELLNQYHRGHWDASDDRPSKSKRCLDEAWKLYEARP